MSVSDERLARNQIVFRDANERIEAVARAGFGGERVPFLCECADLHCTTVIQLTLSEYEQVRAHPRRFLTAPGHEPADATPVHTDGPHEVHEKTGTAGEIAEHDARGS